MTINSAFSKSILQLVPGQEIFILYVGKQLTWTILPLCVETSLLYAHLVEHFHCT